MPEKATALPVDAPAGEIQTKPADLTPAEAFLERTQQLTGVLPEHTELIARITEGANAGAEEVEHKAAERVEALKGFHEIRLLNADGIPYWTGASREEVKTVTDKLTRQYDISDDVLAQSELRARTVKAIVDDRGKKIAAAESEVGGWRARVTQAEKDGFVAGQRDKYWQKALALLDRVDDARSRDVASVFEKAQLLGGFAINRQMGPIHKFTTKREQAEAVWDVLHTIAARDLANLVPAIDHEMYDDALRQIPQFDPHSSYWQQRLRKFTAKLDTQLAAQDYLPELEKVISRLVGKWRQSRGGNGQPTTAKRPNYPPDITGAIDAEVQTLRAAGKTDTQIHRELAKRYHADVNRSDPRADERLGYVNELFEPRQKENAT